ncbi:UNVERIFIED_CONTAM: hypothetical protein GTU68_035441 [Idotea baltica]|nr:hypothetical protein [Idotea baltica]
MKASEVRAKSPDELKDELVKLKKEQFNLRFQQATGQLENTVRMRQVRRDIARIQTIASEKQAAEAKA